MSLLITNYEGQFLHKLKPTLVGAAVLHIGQPESSRYGMEGEVIYFIRSKYLGKERSKESCIVVLWPDNEVTTYSESWCRRHMQLVRYSHNNEPKSIWRKIYELWSSICTR